VSLEVSPLLAHSEEETVQEALRLAALVDRRNLMIKVPATAQGVRAITRLVAAGLNINATLLFTTERYAQVLDAYLLGLERRIAAHQSVVCIGSVASFFVSRIDSLVDPHVRAHADPQVRALSGQCATAFAALAYRHYQAQLSSPRWRSLAAHGAQPQRLLWASTGTKDRSYSDVKYIEALIAPETVTTAPLETLDAYRDHGAPMRRLGERDESVQLDPALVLQQLERTGLTPYGLGAELEADGVRKFVEPHEATLAALRQRIAAVGAPT
jgi:transaldolase